MADEQPYQLCPQCVHRVEHDVSAACRNNQQSHITSQLTKEDHK